MAGEETEQLSERVIDLPPKASALVEAMRDIGYSIEAAVADIIDNSITAGASVIDIRFGWTDGCPWIGVIDNGYGMSRDTLVAAMRAGSVSPMLARKKDDLGRFGLGLKTASFSQCREMTVVSRSSSGLAAARWDLDFVAQTDAWHLIELDVERIAKLALFNELPSNGTLVLWRKIDRLEVATGDSRAQDAMNETMAVVGNHLGRIFHRFLAGEQGHPRVAIRINATVLPPFNPFNEMHQATVWMAKEIVRYPEGDVVIQPFILPHHSKTSAADYRDNAGPEGYLRNQGFYVYRNRRLIVWGTWFRLARQEELTKLARIRIDIPNTLDHVWGIDVRKSRAQPPKAVRDRLRQIIERMRNTAKRPYTHRGKLVIEGEAVPVWVRRVFNDRLEYAVNPDHAFVQEVMADLDEVARAQVATLLELVARCFPAAAFFSDYAAEPVKLEATAPDTAVLTAIARLVRKANPGASDAQLRQLIAGIEPFASWPAVLDDVVRLATEN
jgi:hypothetical protein